MIYTMTMLLNTVIKIDNKKKEPVETLFYKSTEDTDERNVELELVLED